LAKRLSRHGLAVSGAALAVLLSENAASAVPPSLVSSTIQAATAYAAGPTAAASVISATVIALTHGVLRTMLLTKLKIAAAMVVALTVIGVGAGSLIYQAQAAGDANDPSDAVQQTGQDPPTRSADSTKNIPPLLSDDLRGKWTGEKDGIKVELTFYGRQAKWPAHWQVVFKRERPQENPSESPTITVNK